MECCTLVARLELPAGTKLIAGFTSWRGLDSCVLGSDWSWWEGLSCGGGSLLLWVVGPAGKLYFKITVWVHIGGELYIDISVFYSLRGYRVITDEEWASEKRERREKREKREKREEYKKNITTSRDISHHSITSPSPTPSSYHRPLHLVFRRLLHALKHTLLLGGLRNPLLHPLVRERPVQRSIHRRRNRKPRQKRYLCVSARRQDRRRTAYLIQPGQSRCCALVLRHGTDEAREMRDHSARPLHAVSTREAGRRGRVRTAIGVRQSTPRVNQYMLRASRT